MSALKIEIPQVYSFLSKPYRFKVSYGGRAAGRSWAYARAMLIKSLENKLLFVCCREIQTSIKESIYRLLCNQIELLGLKSMFGITDTKIKCTLTGSEFIFKGLFRNPESLKSLEGADIVDIEEAESVSGETWDILLPTIRKPGSEIWIKFNTRYVDDETFVRFVTNRPKNSFVQFTTWQDNPFVSEETIAQKDQDYAFRPIEAKNIWAGEPVGAGMKIYPEFSETLHVKELVIPASAQHFMSMDPAQHYYPASLWLAQWPGELGLTRYVYAEWPTRSDLGEDFSKARKTVLYTGSLADMAREVLAHDYPGVKITKRGIDTRFAKGTGSGSYYSGDTMGLVAEFAKRENGGLTFTCPWEKLIDVALNDITKDLQYNTLLPINAFNKPMLYVSPKCLNLIQSLKNHRLEEGSEKEDSRHKDFSDALKIMYATLSTEKYKDIDGKRPTDNIFKGATQHQMSYQTKTSGIAWMGL